MFLYCDLLYYFGRAIMKWKELEKELKAESKRFIFLACLFLKPSKYTINKLLRDFEIIESDRGGYILIKDLINKGIIKEEEAEKGKRKMKLLSVNLDLVADALSEVIDLPPQDIKKYIQIGSEMMRKGAEEIIKVPPISTVSERVESAREQKDQEAFDIIRAFASMDIKFLLSLILMTYAINAKDQDLLRKTVKLARRWIQPQTAKAMFQILTYVAEEASLK